MSPEEVLERQYPFIDWRRPQLVDILGTGIGYPCCRFCIAIQGLDLGEVHVQSFDTEEDFTEHMVEHHQRLPNLGPKKIAS